MNNKNWIAAFLGLACLALFVTVMGASGNWLNNNNPQGNNGTTPQQVTQTIRGMNNNSVPNENMPTKIDANGVTDTLTDDDSNNGENNNNQNNNNTTETYKAPEQLMLPNMNQ